MNRAGDLLNAFFRLHNISGGESYVSFFSSWHEIVGTDLAAHTQPIDIRGDALIVEVDHPGWMQLLQLKRDQIVKQVRHRYADLGVTNMHMKLVDAGAFSGPEAIQRQAERGGSESSAGTNNRTGEGRTERPRSKDEKEALSRVPSDKLKDTLERLRRDLQDDVTD